MWSTGRVERSPGHQALEAGEGAAAGAEVRGVGPEIGRGVGLVPADEDRGAAAPRGGIGVGHELVEGLGGDQGLAGGAAPGAVAVRQSVQEGGESVGIGGGRDAHRDAAPPGDAGWRTARIQAQAGELGQGLMAGEDGVPGAAQSGGRRRVADDGLDPGAVAGGDLEPLGEVGVGGGIGETRELVGRSDDGRRRRGSGGGRAPPGSPCGRAPRPSRPVGSGGGALSVVVPFAYWSSISPTSPLSIHDPVSIGAYGLVSTWRPAVAFSGSTVVASRSLSRSNDSADGVRVMGTSGRAAMAAMVLARWSAPASSRVGELSSPGTTAATTGTTTPTARVDGAELGSASSSRRRVVTSSATTLSSASKTWMSNGYTPAVGESGHVGRGRGPGGDGQADDDRPVRVGEVGDGLGRDHEGRSTRALTRGDRVERLPVRHPWTEDRAHRGAGRKVVGGERHLEHRFRSDPVGLAHQREPGRRRRIRRTGLGVGRPSRRGREPDAQQGRRDHEETGGRDATAQGPPHPAGPSSSERSRTASPTGSGRKPRCS